MVKIGDKYKLVKPIQNFPVKVGDILKVSSDGYCLTITNNGVWVCDLNSARGLQLVEYGYAKKIAIKRKRLSAKRLPK